MNIINDVVIYLERWYINVTILEAEKNFIDNRDI